MGIAGMSPPKKIASRLSILCSAVVFPWIRSTLRTECSSQVRSGQERGNVTEESGMSKLETSPVLENMRDIHSTRIP
jgi:hypothetical protein